MAEMKKENPVLYIIMRNDLASLTHGKSCAQAAHAANAFVHKMGRLKEVHSVKKLYRKWAKQTPQGFGTTIVLAGTVDAFDDATKYIEQDGGVTFRDEACAFGTIHDPTYPLRDGEFTHLIPLDTCAWFFCDKNGGRPALLAAFGLHP